MKGPGIVGYTPRVQSKPTAHLNAEQRKELRRYIAAVGERTVARSLGTSKQGLEELGPNGRGMRPDVVARIGGVLDEMRARRSA